MRLLYTTAEFKWTKFHCFWALWLKSIKYMKSSNIHKISKQTLVQKYVLRFVQWEPIPKHKQILQMANNFRRATAVTWRATYTSPDWAVDVSIGVIALCTLRSTTQTQSGLNWCCKKGKARKEGTVKYYRKIASNGLHFRLENILSTTVDSHHGVGERWTF